MSNLLKAFHSLKVKTFFAYLFIGIVPGIVLTGLFYNTVRSKSISGDVTSMSTQASLVADEIALNGFFQGENTDTIEKELSTVGNVFSGRVMIIDKTLTVVYDTYDMYAGRVMVWSKVLESANGSIASDYDTTNHTLTVTYPIYDANNNFAGVVLITESAEYIENNLNYYWSLCVLFLLVLTLIILALSLFVSVKTAKPLNDIKTAIDNMSKGFGDSELRVKTTTETEAISESFNSFHAQMKLLDESRQEFVSNVSHELKTPLTSMKVLAESLIGMGDGVPVEMYQEFMTDIVGEVDRETKIVNDLLSLVKMDKTDVVLDITPLNMNELIELIMKRLKPIAEKQQIEMVLESFRPVTVEVDEVKITLAISNLIENGIKYNNPGGFVHVSLNADHMYCYIRIEDSGLGIPEESIDHIFERFYRADKSHSREIGGTGLGLAITKNAIQLHHGEIKVASTLGEGTTFDVRLPLNYIKEGQN